MIRKKYFNNVKFVRMISLVLLIFGLSNAAKSQRITVSGTVKDSTQVLGGVTVSVQGTASVSSN
ncbi:hypothetical protein BC792_1267 [Sphingobacterium allocomposti]|uniref:Uncharacterized protein n=1 Tax=Sphingobacterium allocomposti TaxID=415956 RepID=A0A5S5D1W3_9SPHI|nr:hypothetical protein BC792_1267 [Sphingobacterium composti Yoo et al. 2007 non Ten et al. 2007]